MDDHQSSPHIVRLMAVTKADSEKLFRWRNDPLTRQSSFNQNPITRAEHETWLSRALLNPDRYLYIGRNENDEEVGPVRFDVENEEVEIHISIAPEFRGKGYGTDLVRFSSRTFLGGHPPHERILSRIKEDNEASIRVFIRAGYQEFKRKDGIVYLHFTRNAKI